MGTSVIAFFCFFFWGWGANLLCIVFTKIISDVNVKSHYGEMRVSGRDICIYRCPKKIVPFSKILLFGGRHLENFVPMGTAGISIKTRSI